jgi:hypothetical protein
MMNPMLHQQISRGAPKPKWNHPWHGLCSKPHKMIKAQFGLGRPLTDTLPPGLPQGTRAARGVARSSVCPKYLSSLLRSLAPMLLLLVAQAYGTTYYIDFVSGADGNAGTSKTAPWRLCPGMVGFGHSYSHTAGDRFIFKGGVAWPASVLPLVPPGSGTSSAWDYYGVDQTWYTGASWARPIFDGGGNINDLIAMQTWRNTSTGSYITIDSLEIRNFYFPSDSTDGGIIIYGGGNVVINNCYIHNWSKNTSVTDQNGWAIVAWPPFTGQVTVQNCIINNQDGRQGISGSVACGGALWRVDNVISNEIAYATQGVLHGGRNVIGNHIHHILHSYDSTEHCNNLYVDSYNGGSTFIISGNYIHDCQNEAGTIYDLSGTGTVYIYNNLIVEGDTGHTMVFSDPDNGSVGNIYIYNNTWVSAGDGIFSATIRSAATTASVTIKNNHGLGNANALSYFSSGVSSSIIADHNLYSANGYSAANLYQPSSGSSPTVDAGTSLSSVFTIDKLGVSRPLGAAWDIGAYEYGAANTNPVIAVSPLSLNLPGVTTNSTVTTNFAVRNTGGGILAGTASVPTAYTNFLKIVSGVTYSLGAGQSQVVTILYTPTGASTDSGRIDCGGGGGYQLNVTGQLLAGGKPSLPSPPLNLRIAAVK